MGLRKLLLEARFQDDRRSQQKQKEDRSGNSSTSSSSDDNDDPRKKIHGENAEMAPSNYLIRETNKQTAPLRPSRSSASLSRAPSSLINLAKGALVRRNRPVGCPSVGAASFRSIGKGDGGGRSVSSNSLSTGCQTGPLRRGEPLRRQGTGPFQLDDDGSRLLEDEDYEGDGGSDGARSRDVLRLDGRQFELTEESKKIILSCLANSPHQPPEPASPQYQVEICPKGFGDDDTLDGIMTEKINQERAQRGGLRLFRARSGGSSSVGILSGLRGRATPLGNHKLPTTIVQGGRGSRGGDGEGGDDDTLDEFMSREFKEDLRRKDGSNNMNRTGSSSSSSKNLRRVGSGILERLDRLRRANSKLLDRNDLWLKRALEAIEEAKFSYLTNQMIARKKFRPTSHIIVKRPVTVSEERSDDTEPKVDTTSTAPVFFPREGFEHPPPRTPPLLERITDGIEAILPQCTTDPPPNNLTACAAVEEEPSAPASPVLAEEVAEEDASVALVELFVHYLTCGHVLRDNELRHSPRVVCSTSAASPSTFCVPCVPPIPLMQISKPTEVREPTRLRCRRTPLRQQSLCASTEFVDDEEDDEFAYDDDEDNMCESDDDTNEDSWRRQTKELCRAVDTEFARSSTDITIEEKKGQ